MIYSKASARQDVSLLFLTFLVEQTFRLAYSCLVVWAVQADSASVVDQFLLGLLEAWGF